MVLMDKDSDYSDIDVGKEFGMDGDDVDGSELSEYDESDNGDRHGDGDVDNSHVGNRLHMIEKQGAHGAYVPNRTRDGSQ